MDKFELVTWNVNGIRSFKKNELLEKWKNEIPSHVLCLQETKITRDMLDEQTALWPDTNSYFSFSRKRSGYSGVATYCQDTHVPIKAEEGLGGSLPSTNFQDSVGFHEKTAFSEDERRMLDAEGRCVITEYLVKVPNGDLRSLVLINVYCPRADPEKLDRVQYKLDFYRLLEERARNFVNDSKFVVICGDINTSHREIDHCDPYEEFSDNPGRRWLTQFLEDSTTSGFVDCFRHLNPNVEKVFTCWNTKLNCRSTNYGTRIDYFFIDSSLLPYLQSCSVLSDVMGSDHCPVRLVLTLSVQSGSKFPKHCTKNFLEFSGKQITLSRFLVPISESRNSSSSSSSSSLERTKSNQRRQQSKVSDFFVDKRTKEKTRIFIDESVVVVESKRSRENFESVAAWKSLFDRKSSSSSKSTPICKGHGDPAVLRTVKKKGPNSGRQFWVCCRGEGRADDPEAKCDFFKWF